MQKITGKIHSIETGGTVDGPGIRFVVFTQGCPLQCLYCHNPDAHNTHDGQEISADEIIAEAKKYYTYMKFSGGGITVSGGEPLTQPEFVKAILQKAKAIGIHTALDTSGFVDLEIAKPVLEYVDLVLLDIKSFNPHTYHQITNVPLQPTLDFAKYLQSIHKPTWVRFVLVPNLSDDQENMTGLAEFVAQLDNVEKVEILPFHKMGEYKWENLAVKYQLKNTQPPTTTQVQNAIALFRQYNLAVH